MTGTCWRVLLVGALMLIPVGCGSDAAGDSATTTDGSNPVDGTQTLTLMAIGDSITAGPYYRPHLVRAVAAADCPVDFIGTFEGAGDPPLEDAADLDLQHQAVGGATSTEIRAGIDGWLEEQPAPDIALVYLGTNDFFAGVDRATTIENIEAIIDALRRANPDVSIVLAQIMPADGVATGVAALNARLAVAAQRLGTTASPVVVVDMASGVTVERDLVDGVHPTDERSQEMASRWAGALRPLLGDRCQL